MKCSLKVVMCALSLIIFSVKAADEKLTSASCKRIQRTFDQWTNAMTSMLKQEEESLNNKTSRYHESKATMNEAERKIAEQELVQLNDNYKQKLARALQAFKQVQSAALRCLSA